MSDKNVNYNINVKTDKDKVDQLNQSIKQTGKETSSVKDNINSISGGKLGALTGIIGKVTGSFKTLRLAIISSGIGALALAILAVGKAFTSSEEGQNKFQKLMGRIGVVLGNVMDIVADFGDILIGAFENPKKAWESFVNALKAGYGIFKTQVIDRFLGNLKILSGTFEKGILKMRIAWNKFTGDSEEATKLEARLADVNAKIQEGIDLHKKANTQIVETWNAATNAVKEYIEVQKEEMRQADIVSNQRAQADKLERSLIVQRAKLQGEINSLKLKSRQEEQFSTQERIEALKDAQKLEDQLLIQEQEVLRLRYEAIKAENTFSKSTKENKKAEAEALAELYNIEARRKAQQKTTQVELNRLNRQAASAKKQEGAEARKEEEKRVADLIKIQEDYVKKLEDLAANTEMKKIELEEARALSELDRLKASEEEKLNVIKFFAEQKRLQREEEAKIKAEEEEAKAEKDAADREKKAEQDAQNLIALETLEQAKRDSKKKTLDDIIAMTGEEAALGRAALLAKQLINAQELILDIQKNLAFKKGSAERMITSATEATVGAQISVAKGAAETAKVGFPQNIPLIIGYAVQAAGIIAAVKKAVSAAKSKSGGGGGAVSSPKISGGSAPQVAKDPSFNIVGGSEASQLTQAVNSQNQRPIQAYVTSGEVTTSQELNRNRIQDAGF